MSKRYSKRRGITLVEVMFAMGVALIGLVGLISVLPVAGRRTQDAINLNDGSALAHSIFDELKSRGILKQAAWRVRSDLSVARAATLNPNRAGGADALDNATSWCIDPLFVASTASALSEADGGFFNTYIDSAGNGYRRLLFPYYRAEHNPLYDPSINGTNRSTSDENWWIPTPTYGANGASTSPFGSRMTRVGLPGVSSILQRGIEAEFIVDDRDGISSNGPKDRSLNATMQGRTVVPSGFEFGKALTDGSLSWIATVNKLPGTDFASVAVIILRNRDRGFTTYLNTAAGAAPSPNENAVDERLAYVTYASGFSGGAGGTVHIVGASNTSSELSTNDWVMLSRRNASGNDIHRWYRVLSVGKEALEITMPDPVTGSTRTVWEHKIFLDGPDWTFGFDTAPADTIDAPGPADTSVADNTYVTILKDVVAVAEHVILLE
ncbi:MAG: hypothetical protein WBD31_01500 [Rubripirellula sp.]